MPRLTVPELEAEHEDVDKLAGGIVAAFFSIIII